MFATAFKKHKYEGKYFYCYCTKSSHFSFIVEEALKNDIHLETSYAYDIEIIKKLYEKKKITKDIHIICNGFKQKSYTRRIANLLNTGFRNVIPILDNKDELKEYAKSVKVRSNSVSGWQQKKNLLFPFILPGWESGQKIFWSFMWTGLKAMKANSS